MDRIVIVGGGLAAATAAEQLRQRAFEGDVQLFAAERHNPYIRPPLSKEYFAGKEDKSSIFVHPEEWYRDNAIALTTGVRATGLDPRAHELTLHDGRVVGYDRLLLATGATPRRLDAAGGGAAGIHYLRTVEDSERLRDALAEGGRQVVVIGGGWIGLELAAGARSYGNEVTVVMRDAVPLESALGAELGTMFRELHEGNGVTFHPETGIRAFEQRDGHVTGVVTDAGTLPADVVIVGVGADPDTRLAEQAGLAVDNGVLVDEHLGSSAPDVFAAGDIANAMHPVIGMRMRNEHWKNAIETGKVAAAAMLGGDDVLDAIPYFYTDQYDLGMEYSGYPPLTKNAEVVYRGDRQKREFIAFWLAHDRVVAGMNVNVWDVNEGVQQLIRSRRTVSADRLRDESVALDAV
ncbi:MAG: FAD-dependent oxidoreductase [Rhodoglobus sp.]|nr:FAD-dependent oxidoreductase [Rhodoglobus sp.]